MATEPVSRAALRSRVDALAPGVSVAVVLGMAATFISEHYGAPAMLMALLLGIAFHFLAEEGKCVAGIDFAARTILRIGVALLGVRISLDLLVGLGPAMIALVVSAVIATIAFGTVAARLLGAAPASACSPAGRWRSAAPPRPWPSPPCCPAPSAARRT